MKKALVLVLVLSFALCGFGGPAPESPRDDGTSGDVYPVDNFDDGNYTDPEWWKFDNVTLTTVKNSSYQTGEEQVVKEIGAYSLNIKGKAADWYAGGCGIYIAKPKTNYSAFSAIQLDVFGNGPGSGTLQVEIYDDDNGNWQAEQDPKKQYKPMYDDKLQYQISVNWKGWKRVIIPIADFEDVNPGIGDDVWNPEQKGGSGGFLQIQIIAIGPNKTGNINYNIDNIMLVK
jgi:hypothetical protein